MELGSSRKELTEVLLGFSISERELRNSTHPIQYCQLTIFCHINKKFQMFENKIKLEMVKKLCTVPNFSLVRFDFLEKLFCGVGNTVARCLSLVHL
jgi:hypothetical protein